MGSGVGGVFYRSYFLGCGGTGISEASEWDNDHLAVGQEPRWSDRKSAIVAFDPSSLGRLTTLQEGSSQERYENPGHPVDSTNAQDFPVLKLTPDGRAIYFFVQGATPKGDQPFVGVMPFAGGEEKIVWRASACK